MNIVIMLFYGAYKIIGKFGYLGFIGIMIFLYVMGANG